MHDIKGLNNLIEVDEVNSVISVDFYYRNNWVDPRWIMNESFWDEQRPDLSTVVCHKTLR